MKATLVLALLGLILLPACSSTDDLASDRERALNERAAENESLRKRRADDEAMRMVMAKELEQARAEAAANEAERERLEKEMQARLAANQKEYDLRLAAMAEKSKRGGPVSKENGLEIDRTASGEVVMRLDHGVTFASGSADLSDSGKKLLRGEVARIISEHPGSVFSIEGHTDDTPVTKSRWGNNLNLSIARALAVQEYLAQATKVKKDQTRVVGYGDTRPLAKGKAAADRMRNRRVEIVILRSQSN
jgi:chemotaxis protein MotB